MSNWVRSPKSGKSTPTRKPANAALDATLSTNERILRDVHELYVDLDEEIAGVEPVLKPAALLPGKEGIMAICSKLGMSCIAPRRKINVMVVGAFCCPSCRAKSARSWSPGLTRNVGSIRPSG